MARRKLRFYKKEKKINIELVKKISLWAFEIGVTIVMAVIAAYIFGQRITVIGSSMEDSIQAGKEVWINKSAYMLSSPKRFDVIVFQPNGNKKEHYYVKRVIGLPGETIQIRDGKIYIDGEQLKEDKKYEKIIDGGIAEEEYVIGNDEYFVLGDNRNNSDDSRNADIGAVSFEYIQGKAWLQSKGIFNFGKVK